MDLTPKMLEKREKFLACALELFIEKGYFDTPVREIIEKSGLGTGTFYKYFNNKEELLKTLLEEFSRQIISGVKNYYTTEKDLYTRFIETKRVTMEIFAQNKTLSEIYIRVAGASDTIDACLKDFEDRLIGFSVRNLEYGIQKGIFHALPVVPIAHAILAIEKYLLYKWIVLGAISKEEMLSMVVSFHESLAVGLLAEKGE